MADLGDYSDEEIEELESEVGIGDSISSSGVDSVDVGGEAMGVVTASGGIRLGEEHEVTAYITASNRGEVRLGKYFVVPYPDEERLLVSVSEVRYKQRYRSDDANEIYALQALDDPDMDEEDYKFLAGLEPEAIITGDGRRVPDRAPKPHSPLQEPRSKEDLKTGLDIPSDGVFIGHLAVAGELVTTMDSPPTVDYRLLDSEADTNPLIFRHVLISGGTGSGKSHTSKNILRQIVESSYSTEIDGQTAQRQPSIVIFDPQNEYSEMHDDPGLSNEEKRSLEAQGIKHGGYNDTLTLVPDIDGYTYSANHGARQVEFSIPFTMARRHPYLLTAADLNDTQYNALTSLINDYFKEATDPTYQGFTSYINNPKNRERYIENGSVHEATYDAVKRRVTNQTSLDRVFDNPSRRVNDPKAIKDIVRPGGITVVPTYHINDNRSEQITVLALASLLIRNKLSEAGDKHIKQTPLVVAMDEAHNFLAEGDTPQKRAIMRRFSNAAKQGRKERLALFLITQDPGDIANPVFKQINTKIAMNLSDENAIKSLSLPTRFQNRVPYLERGEMVVHSPDNSNPVELKGLSFCVTQH